MNRKIMNIVCVLFGLFMCPVSVLSAQGFEPKSVTVSFDYTVCKGFASNQFAVWIEDLSGLPVKTLFVTEFTADKGWKKRPDSLPDWVSNYRKSSFISDSVSGATAVADKKRSNSKDFQVLYGLDAVSGATGKSGNRMYMWDFTNETGKRVSEGTYIVKLEGTLFWEHRVLYSASVSTKSEEGVVPVMEQIYPVSVQKGGNKLPERNKSMITNVVVSVQ